MRIAAAFFLLSILPAGARAAGPSGTYSGRYQCGRWNTAELSVNESGGRVTAVFTFPLSFLGMPGSGSYQLTGQYNSSGRRLQLQGHHWVSAPVPGWPLTGMDGTFDPATQKITGKMTNFTCGDFEFAAGAAGSAISQSTPVPPPVLPPERRQTPTALDEAWKMTFEYLDAAMLDGLGPIRESEPIDDVFDRLSTAHNSCVGTTPVRWDATGTKGTANDQVLVTESFAIECDGDCRGVRYSPQVSAAVLHTGLSSPAPLLVIKTPWAGGAVLRWNFTRPPGGQPPEIFIHRWSASKFNNGSPGCKPPKSMR